MNEAGNFSKKWIAIICIAIAGVGFVFYYQYYRMLQPSQRKGRNWYSEVREGRWARDVESAISQAPENPTGAVTMLNNVLAQVTDPGQKSVVDLTRANVTFLYIDKLRGAESYAAVAVNKDYPPISRAYAMMVIVDQYNALQDVNLLKPFFSEQDFSSEDSDTLLFQFYQKIYDTHPFGLAAGQLGIRYIRSVRTHNTITDQEYGEVVKYITAIDKSLVELESADPMKTYIPVTLLTRARFFELLAEVNRLTPDSVSSSYLLAIARSRTLSILSTEQFSILFYANFLAKKKENSGEVLRLLTVTAESPSSTHPTVKGFLNSTERVKSFFPNLHTLIQEDSQVRTAFQKLATK